MRVAIALLITASTAAGQTQIDWNTQIKNIPFQSTANGRPGIKTTAFSSLGTVQAAGYVVYCVDCTPAPICSGSGSGALALSNGTSWTCGASGSGGGVSTFSSGSLSPLFTTSVATPTTTPALSFTLLNATQGSVLAGPPAGGAGVPSYQTSPVLAGSLALSGATAIPSFGTGGAYYLTEGTATTAASGADICYADSSLHAIRCSFNGGSYFTLGSGGSGGTVTSFSATSTVSPLFTTSVSTATTTPALTITISNAAQGSLLAGPASGGAGAPTYQTSVVLAGSMAFGGSTASPTFGTGGANYLVEGTATSAASGADICYADSTAHAIKCSYNGGSFFTLGSGMVYPGAGIAVSTGSSWTSAATAANIVSLFSSCSGTQYLGADGACHSGGGGMVYPSAGIPNSTGSAWTTTPPWYIQQDPVTTANNGLISLGAGGFAGGGSNFAGSANGTYLAINLTSGGHSDFANWQQGGVLEFEVAANGIVYSSNYFQGMFYYPSSTQGFYANGTIVATGSLGAFVFTSAGPTGTADVSISRVSPGVTAFGTGAQGSTAGSLQFATMTIGNSSFVFNGHTCTIVSTVVTCP